MVLMNGADVQRCKTAGLAMRNTHSVDEALQKPFGGVNPACHLLFILWGRK